MGNKQDSRDSGDFSRKAAVKGRNRFLVYAGLVTLGVFISTITLLAVFVLIPGITLSLLAVFLAMVAVSAIAAWPLLLFLEKSPADESLTQLLHEIEARQKSERELERARESADAKNVAKSKYVRGMSHELRTPLNAILGYAQLLESDDALPAHLQHNARVIRRSGEHLSSLVDGLLDISMIEAGRLQVRKEEFGFSDFLNQVADMMRLQARNAGLAFHFEPAANLPDVIATDEKKLRQILINLLSNAIRYTEQGSVTLRVRYSGQVARFEVEDTGIGISPENLDRIFSPFERIENSNRAISGSGLGLTITQHLAMALGGEITVKSDTGKGSLFSVRLFLPPVHAPKQHTAKDQIVTGYSGRRRSILAIDDDVDQIAFLRAFLGKLGFEFEGENSGQSGLARASARAFDLVILDMSMPDLNGWQVARNLREVSRQRIPVIILSASVPENSEITAARDIHEAYLMKPVNPDRLLETIEKCTGVEWIYAASQQEAPAATREIPDLQSLSALQTLGKIGHLQGIKLKLEEISAQQPAASATLIPLREMADNCDITGFRKAIETLMNHAPR